MLTDKQKYIFDIIVEYIDKEKMPPTTRELCELTGLSSTSTVHAYLKKLEQKGYISKKKVSPRSIKILKN